MEKTNNDYSNVRDVLKDLGAKHGEVITRFPPEPSGYLHIGHIKASMLNYHYAKMYGGKMILRFDDTNPTAEKIEFVENILADLKTLEIIPDRVTFSSDYFDQLQKYCRKLIEDGNAYADNTPHDQMKDEREKMIDSKCKSFSVAENLKHFEAMVAGKAKDFCIRAKMNMQDKVGCLRDPVFYRCKDEVHHRTGSQYKAYPTYDLTVAVVDSLEGVTHALRTIEYRDRNPLYAWVQEKLGLRKCAIYDFSKLCMASTVLSKRKLNWFVNEKLVEGWDDPRFPTVQGIMRKGMTVQALKEFMLEQGPSQNNNLMEWDKIWANNKKVIDPVCPRYTCVDSENACVLFIKNGPSPLITKTQPLHPKNEATGQKVMSYGQNLLIEKDDAASIAVGEKITLMKWGNCTISEKKEKDGKIELIGEIDEKDQDFKKTKKITWLCNDPDTVFKVKLVEFAHLIDKQKIEEFDKIEDLVNKNSRFETESLCEGGLKAVQKGDIIQFERLGYYICDNVSLNNKQAQFFQIPDGKAKAMSTITHKLDASETQKGKGTATGKGADKKKAAGKGPDGELSKAELKKQEKKAAQAAAKQAFKEGKIPEAKAKKPAQATQVAGAKAGPVHANCATGEIVDSLERDLQHKMWVGGAEPSQQDYLAFLNLHGKSPSPITHPYTFAWYAGVVKFVDAIKTSWPAEKKGKYHMPGDKPAQKEEVKQEQPKKDKKEKAAKAEKPAAAAKTEGDQFDAFLKSDMRVGKIVECKVHPDSDKLYVEQIDIGEGRLRTIGSGLQKFIPLDQMTQGLCVVYANLKPRKLADLMSEGMVLCAGNADHTQIELMRPPEGAKVGERVVLEGNPAGDVSQEFQPVLNPKKKIAEAFLPCLKTNDACEGTYNGVKFMTSKGAVTCKTLKQCGIS